MRSRRRALHYIHLNPARAGAVKATRAADSPAQNALGFDQESRLGSRHEGLQASFGAEQKEAKQSGSVLEAETAEVRELVWEGT